MQVEEETVSAEATLESGRSEVLDRAYTALQSAHTVHYEAAGEPFTRQRLGQLHDLVVEAIRDRDLSGIEAYSESIANERFTAGFDITEVQTAFNALEREMWRRLAAESAPDELEEAIGLLSTVLGVAKDVLARTYVSLATKRHVRSLDLSALFRGEAS